MTKSNNSAQESVAERYDQLVKEYPELFRGGGDSPNEISILLGRDERSLVEEREKLLLCKKGLPSNWGDVGVVFEDPYITILRDAVRFPDGSEGEYIRIIPHDIKKAGVAILPVCHGRIVLIKHFRHATRQWHWEIPRGFGSSEDVNETMKNELLEELNATPIDYTSLGYFHPDSGKMMDEVSLFCTHISSYSVTFGIEPIREAKEFSVREVKSMIASGEITDSFTIVAFFRAVLLDLLVEH